AHLLVQLSRSGSPLLAKEPKFVIARTTDTDILEVIWTNQDVIPCHEMHYSEEGSSRQIAGQALNNARIQVQHHGVTKTLCHERDTLVIRRYVRTFTEMGQNLNIRRQMLEWTTRDPLSQWKEQGKKQQLHSHL